MGWTEGSRLGAQLVNWSLPAQGRPTCPPLDAKPSTGLYEDAALGNSCAKRRPWRVTAIGILGLALWLPGGWGLRQEEQMLFWG